MRWVAALLAVALAASATGAATAFAQLPPGAVAWEPDDSARAAQLLATGIRRIRPGVVLLAPADSVDARWLEAFADTLGRAVRALRALVGGPDDWQRIGGRPVRFYLSPGRFVSHGDGQGGVFIALARVRRGEAPWLHEAAHELLVPTAPFYPFEHGDTLAQRMAAQRFPLWLSEGLPDVLAQRVRAATGFPEGDVFQVGGEERADSTCAARLRASPRRRDIAARVGTAGFVDALFTNERAQVAPVFYACSQSFTAHLARRIGVPALVALFPGIPGGGWRDALESAAGATLPELRRAWLAALALPGEW